MPQLLIVDDDPVMRALIARVLGDLAEIAAVASGLDALRELNTRKFDAVIVDLHMPMCDGFRVLQISRQRIGPNRRTKVIVVSADCSRAARERAMELGAVLVLGKPLRVAELRTLACGVLGIHPGRGESDPPHPQDLAG